MKNCRRVYRTHTPPNSKLGATDPQTSHSRCVKTNPPSFVYPQGGHTDWPPRDDEEFELLQFLRKKFQQKARVSVERVISGPGIATIYEFLAEKYPEQVRTRFWGSLVSWCTRVLGMLQTYSTEMRV